MKKNSLITLILLSSFVVLSACGSNSSTNETTVSSGPEKQLESESASEEPVAPIETSMKKTEASDEINAFELEEDLYPLQMVLSQILDNGWEITDIAETTTQNVNGTDVMVDSGYVLTRGDSQISVFLLEYDCFEGIDPSECEVKAISIFPEQVSSFKLGDAEVIGMTKEDVTVLLGEENFKSIFSHFDLFNLLYGYETSWIRRFTKQHTFELIGTYEYGDKLVDILEWKSGGRLSATAHIVEDDWGILKIQVKFGPEAMCCEARDIGGGIYMPVNLTVNPAVTYIPAEKIPRAITIVQNMKTINKRTKERAVDLLKSHLGHDFAPYMVIGYNIRYDRTPSIQQ